MKKYSSNRAQKGKTAYRTPSRWLSGRPEALKRDHAKMNKMPEKIHSYIPYQKKTV